MLQCLKRQLKVDSGDWQNTSGNFYPVFPSVSLSIFSFHFSVSAPHFFSLSLCSRRPEWGISLQIWWKMSLTSYSHRTSTVNIKLPKRDDISITDGIFGSGVLLKGRACWNNTFTIFKYLFVFPVINICEEHGSYLEQNR